MNSRLEPYDLHRAAETVNGWQEDVRGWEKVGGIRAAVSAGTGGGLQRVNDLMRIDSTHTAVTWDEVKAGDRLTEPGGDPETGAWEALYVIPGGRRKMNQVFLRRVEAPEEQEGGRKAD